MTTFERVRKAQSVREAVQYIPDVFYERVALVALMYWLIVSLLLWWPGESLGLGIGLLASANLQVGIVAVAIGVLLLVARRVGAALDPARDPLRRNVPLVLFGVFLALATVSALVSATDATWTGDGYRRESLITYVSYVGFFFLATQVLAPARRKLLLGMVLGLALVTCLVVVPAALIEGWSSGAWQVPTRPRAYFHQFNHYGYLLAVGGALAVSGALVSSRRVARWALLAAFAGILFTLLLNDTLGAYIALVVGSIAVLVSLAVIRRLHVGTAIALVGIVVVVHIVAEWMGIGILGELMSLGNDVRSVSAGEEGAAAAGTGRWGLWVTTAQQIVASPWLGHGVEGIADLLPVGYGRPHNEYLQYAVFFGIPALIAYLGAVITIFVRVVRRAGAVDATTLCAATAAATYLVSALFGNTMYYTAPFLFLLLGVAWGGIRSQPADAGTLRS